MGQSRKKQTKENRIEEVEETIEVTEEDTEIAEEEVEAEVEEEEEVEVEEEAEVEETKAAIKTIEEEVIVMKTEIAKEKKITITISVDITRTVIPITETMMMRETI